MRKYILFPPHLDYLASDNFTLDELLSRALQVGEYNLKVMALLDEAHTSTMVILYPLR